MGTIKDDPQILRHLFHVTIEQAVDGIFWLDANGHIHRANDAACRLLGYTKEELLNLTIPDIDPDFSIKKYQEFYWQEIKKAGWISFESRHRRKDGSIYSVEITSHYVELDGTGYSCTFFRDITKRKQAEVSLKASESKLRAIINHHFQLTGLLAPDGRLLMANETALNLIGVKESAVLGRYFWETPWWKHSKPLQSKLRKAIKRAAKGEFVRFEAMHPDLHGNLRLFDTSFCPLEDEDGQVSFIIPEARDITDLKQAEAALQQALSELKRLKNRLEEENVYLQEEIKLEHNFGTIIGRSKVLRDVLGQVEKVATTDATVLILGETGTGKELIARAIHEHSNRKSRPLVKVNCAVLPANLIESELFGHEKGAFTGAVARKIGRFELANGGTIFLDEIGDMPMELQAKLLRVLQEGEFERVGNPKTLKVDVRVIAGTNRELEKLTQSGDFREDLYYRLNVYPILCPSLRDRKEDIPLLAQHFLTKYSAKIGKNIKIVSKKVIKTLQAYHWPGNVRELENIIERAVVLSPGNRLKIGDWLPTKESSQVEGEIASLAKIERDHILRALKKTKGQVSGENGAAKLLELHPQTLFSKMRKLNISRKVNFL
jgi:formate hydrogenlyase transcriptional activator